ncbi:MAG: hypothetical protein ABJC79_17485 [Acidimicrobiia bacterium]
MAVTDESDALEAALDELYGADPSDFVDRRKALAAELRTAGDKRAAKALMGARRPTTAAGALNRLARTAPEIVRSLLERSQELEAAQMGAGPGGREGVREVTQAHRDALGVATEAALAVLGDRATDAYRTQLQATLRAAGAEPEVGDLLRSGRFVKELTGPSGFPEGFTLTVVPDLEPGGQIDAPGPPTKSAIGSKSRSERRASTVSERPKADATERLAAQKADAVARARQEREVRVAAAAERKRAEAEMAWRAALEVVDTAAAEASEADRRVERLAADLDVARRDATSATELLTSARRAAGKLERSATGKPKPKIHRS